MAKPPEYKQEQFNSQVQKRLFNDGSLDKFLTGLCRAFTLNCAGHYVDGYVMRNGSGPEVVSAQFHDDQGHVFEVTVKEGKPDG